jgi:hypothetical protein
MSLVEQELFTLPVHLSSSPVFSGVRVTQSLVLYVCFVDRCLSFCTFSFGHCVVCSSLIYGFRLPLIPIILKVVANHYRVKFCHRLIRCVLINYLRYTIKLIMGDVGQIGVSEEQSRRYLVLIQICFNVIQ